MLVVLLLNNLSRLHTGEGEPQRAAHKADASKLQGSELAHEMVPRGVSRKAQQKPAG